MIESHSQQRLAWEDAKKARIARDRAEAQASARFHAMLEANPSGQLGTSSLDNAAALKTQGFYDHAPWH
jgi:hypothetical protein